MYIHTYIHTVYVAVYWVIEDATYVANSIFAQSFQVSNSCLEGMFLHFKTCERPYQAKQFNLSGCG